MLSLNILPSCNNQLNIKTSDWTKKSQFCNIYFFIIEILLCHVKYSTNFLHINQGSFDVVIWIRIKISFLYPSSKHELSDWSHNSQTFSFARLMFLVNDFFIMSWKTTRISFYENQTNFDTSTNSQLSGLILKLIHISTLNYKCEIRFWQILVRNYCGTNYAHNWHMCKRHRKGCYELTFISFE